MFPVRTVIIWSDFEIVLKKQVLWSPIKAMQK